MKLHILLHKLSSNSSLITANTEAAAAESYDASGPTADHGHSQDLNLHEHAGLLEPEGFAQQQRLVEPSYKFDIASFNQSTLQLHIDRD